MIRRVSHGRETKRDARRARVAPRVRSLLDCYLFVYSLYVLR